MESFSRVFPLDWTTLQHVSAVVGLVAVVLGLLAFLLRRALRRDERQSRIAAEQIAVLIAGEMMARSQEDGDRFSLKESNSIKALIAEAVLALNTQDTRTRRRAVAQLKAANSARATEIFAGIARTKRAEAEGAARQAASALRHQGALTLPKDGQGALALFQQAFELDPANAENLLALALVQFRLGDIPSVEALIDKARRRKRGARILPACSICSQASCISGAAAFRKRSKSSKAPGASSQSITIPKRSSTRSWRWPARK